MPHTLDWLHEACTARDRYRQGLKYKDYPNPPAKGWCARAARVLFREVTGRVLPFAQKDADHDGDVDAKDMLRLERAAGYVVSYRPGQGLLPGWRLYWTRGRNGHVATVVGINPMKVFENTTAKRGYRGPGSCITPVSALPCPEWVGRYLPDKED